jgi:2-methylcitrate dehydratase PrpD
MVERIQIAGDDALARDQASVELDLVGGHSAHVKVEHASGTVANPMSDDEIDSKYKQNVKDFQLSVKADENLNRMWALDN